MGVSRREVILWGAAKLAGLTITGGMAYEAARGAFQDAPKVVKNQEEIDNLRRSAELVSGMPSQEEVFSARGAIGLPVPDALGLFLIETSEYMGRTSNDLYDVPPLCNPQTKLEDLKARSCGVLTVANEKQSNFKKISEDLGIPEKKLQAATYSLRRVPVLIGALAGFVAASQIDPSMRPSRI